MMTSLIMIFIIVNHRSCMMLCVRVSNFVMNS